MRCQFMRIDAGERVLVPDAMFTVSAIQSPCWANKCQTHTAASLALEHLYEEIGTNDEVYGYCVVSAIDDLKFTNEPELLGSCSGFGQKLVIGKHA